MALVALAETGDFGGIVFLFAGFGLVCAALYKGRNLNMIFRTVLVISIVYFSYAMTLQGRTMGTGLDFHTVKYTAIFFALFGLPSHLVMLRLFRRPAAYRAIALGAFASISGALAVASVEEMLFVAKHRHTGAGPTPRWTIPHHWMSYDAGNHKLEGSD